ncbi:hypothetical protein [Mucilaginibacter paludis]|uniref:Uncharacterized protein n=1 Tax=Mucilaginibacter paludis DSM 18603 TaxID=714943 RepID=H1YCW4_9SPHI|nr:hypothetical protein [Mucilaginibacter paludis]EHQ25135.1 hypothetical protein Mucpa_0960 [Mucilaginibacter paludis DSM 18603]
MKDFEHLMTVWQNQPVKEQLSVDEALKQVKKGMSGLRLKTMQGIIGISIALAVIVISLLFAVFTSWASYIGLLALIIGMSIYLSLQIGDYRTISSHDPTIDPVKYLDTLKIYQKRRAYLYDRFYYIYAAIITIGIGFYTVEALEGKALLVKLVYYALTTAFIVFCSLFLKDRIISNEKEKVKLIIEKLERLKDQFEG